MVIHTRFAPSPTGRLHLGHAWSAIQSHDFARDNRGRFTLRIEDIDGTRSRTEHVEAILRDLEWLGLAWDGEAGWYAGGQLGHARFSQNRGAALQLYGGRVVELVPGLDGEAGVAVHAYQNVSHYDYQEVYAGLLGERWNLRAYFSPDYYGVGQRTLYTEFNLRWPLMPGVAALGHAGLLHARRGEASPYAESRDSTRLDLRAGASWQLGPSSELQLVCIAAGRGGPYTWTDATRRRTVVLSLTTAF